jgi:hypothetical protein
MSDDKSKVGEPDRSRVAADQSYEVSHLTQKHSPLRPTGATVPANACAPVDSFPFRRRPIFVGAPDTPTTAVKM